MKSLAGQRAIVTGASSGIGRAIALALGAQGVRLALCGRSPSALEQTASALPAGAPAPLIASFDVGHRQEATEQIKRLIERLGGLDILVNCAGLSMRAAFADLDLQVVENLMQTNFYGTLYCTHAALPALLASRGSVVGIISIAGYVGLPYRTGYSASKFAVRGFLDTLRGETRGRGLHVLVAAPGFTASNIRERALTGSGAPQGQTPRDESKMMSAEEVARRVVRAIIKRKKRLTLTTSGRLAVRLNALCPGFVDWAVYRMMRREPNAPS